MLGKLLKKDFYATCRFFVPLLCGYGVAAAVGKILFEIILSQSRQSFDSGWFNGIVVFSVFYMIIFAIYFIACYLMTSVFIVYDFYKTMVSDHGYLTHTLPVKTSSLIWSKTLISAFWHILVNVIVGLSVVLLFTGHMRDFPLMHMIEHFLRNINSRIESYTFFTGLNGLIGLFQEPLMFFACIAVGQLWKEHRILGAILAYIGMHVLTQILNTIVLVVAGNRGIYLGYTEFSYSGYMIYTTLFSLITAVGCFLVANYILSRRLNLE